MDPEPIPLKGRQYTLERVAEMVPFVSVNALVCWLKRHRDAFPPYHRRFGSTRLRVLRESEVEAIHRLTVKPFSRRRIVRSDSKSNL
jgi:hypothetical protein